MFCSEGNPTTLLVTNTAGRRRKTEKQFATAEIALAWCRANLVMLVYLPVALERN